MSIIKNKTEQNIAINVGGKIRTLPASGELKFSYDIWLNDSVRGLIENESIEYYDTLGRKALINVWDESTMSEKSTVNYVAPKHVTILAPDTQVKMGETLELSTSVSPDNATDKTVTWTSADETVATVEDGTVTPVKEGQVDIVATLNGIQTRMTIFVVPADDVN